MQTVAPKVLPEFILDIVSYKHISASQRYKFLIVESIISNFATPEPNIDFSNEPPALILKTAAGPFSLTLLWYSLM